jgi:hypothetical protein
MDEVLLKDFLSKRSQAEFTTFLFLVKPIAPNDLYIFVLNQNIYLQNMFKELKLSFLYRTHLTIYRNLFTFNIKKHSNHLI